VVIPGCPTPVIDWCLVWFWFNVFLFAVVAIMVVVVAGFVGAALVAFGLTACGVGAFLDAGYLAILLAIAYYAARCSGCLRAPDGSIRCFP
jgi:hypothetical protein